MNNFKRILTTLIVCTFIFNLNISDAKPQNINDPNLNRSKISQFIPENNELIFYSKYKNNEINRFIKKRFTNDKIKKINIIKNGLISFLGFELKENLNNIYDGELILSTFKEPNKKREILIIFKAKKEGDLSTIMNVDGIDFENNKVIEIARPNSLNLLKYVFQTNDNYIICSSNKDLINNSIKTLNNKEAKKIRDRKFKYFESITGNNKLFLYTSKQFYNFINIRPFNLKDINLLTKFNFEDNQLVLNSFTLDYVDTTLNENDLNFEEKNNIILLSNNINIYKNLLNNSVKKNLYKELFTDIKNIIRDKILIKINENNWVIGFKTPINNISINQLDSLNDFHQDKFKNDKYMYTIFSKNNLEFVDQETIYTSEQPIFVYESKNLTFLSNDLSELLNTLNAQILENLFNKESNNIIIEDNLIIKNFDNQIYKELVNVINTLNYFTVDGFSLTLDTFESKITQKTPEKFPSVLMKTYIKLS